MSTKGYGEDRSEPHINVSSLEKEFNLSKKQQNQLNQVEEMRDTLKEEEKKVRESKEDPDDILYKNIQRANNLLDTLQENISNGNSEPRMFEVAGQLINAITTASSSIVGVTQHDDDMEYKQKWLEFKEKELAVKQAAKAVKGGGKEGIEGGYQQNNIIVSDRESLIQFLKSNKEQIQSSNEEE